MTRRARIGLSVFSGSPSDCICDVLIVGVFENGSADGKGRVPVAVGKVVLERLVKSRDLSGKIGDATLLLDCMEAKARRVVVAGLGRPDQLGVEGLSVALTAAMALLPRDKASKVVILLTAENIADASPYYVARCVARTVGDSLYQFAGMKSTGRASIGAAWHIAVATRNKSDRSHFLKGLKHGQAIAEGMSIARDLSNEPPNICTPAYFAKTARALTQQHDKLRTQVLGEAQMKRLGMRALLSVAAGSIEAAKMVVMKYDGAPRSRAVVLVGKGVTFDSGGLSLKQPDGMSAMKFDMAGAAAVLGVVTAVATLRLPVNLVAILPLCENLPGSGATRPGDVITCMSGQTVEIVDTDGEGRLMLCDALTYARRFKPSMLIDVATLTGAVAVALGTHYTAVMANDECLADELIDAGAVARDPAWRMPIGQHFEKQLDSTVADLANVASNRHGAACVAASFLATFVRDLKWAHLDSGGSGWPAPGTNCATGRPVPMLAEFLLRTAGAIPQ